MKWEMIKRKSDLIWRKLEFLVLRSINYKVTTTKIFIMPDLFLKYAPKTELRP